MAWSSSPSTGKSTTSPISAPPWKRRDTASAPAPTPRCSCTAMNNGASRGCCGGSAACTPSPSSTSVGRPRSTWSATPWAKNRSSSAGAAENCCSPLRRGPWPRPSTRPPTSIPFRSTPCCGTAISPDRGRSSPASRSCRPDMPGAWPTTARPRWFGTGGRISSIPRKGSGKTSGSSASKMP